MNLATFHIDAVIVHDIPRRDASGAGQPPVLSEVERSPTQSILNFFRERINRSLSDRAYAVERDPDATSPVPGGVATIVGDPTTLISQSQDMARHLYAEQTGVNTPGLLVVARGTVEGSACVGILKLEREDGIRVHQVDEHGHVTFDIEYFADLMLTKNTRVFKASLFTAAGAEADALDGLVSDDQRGYDPRKEVADFFLRRFLGCRLKEASDVLTKNFFLASQDFFNSGVVPDPEVRTRYEIALLANMTSPSVTVNPATFASSYIDTEHRQAFRQHLRNAGIGLASFDKDTGLIQPRIRLMSIEFEESKLRLLGSTDAIDNYVKWPAQGQVGVRIEDQVKQVRGGR